MCAQVAETAEAVKDTAKELLHGNPAAMKAQDAAVETGVEHTEAASIDG